MNMNYSNNPLERIINMTGLPESECLHFIFRVWFFLPLSWRESLKKIGVSTNEKNCSFVPIGLVNK